jgi:hypothetical protein
VKNSRQARLSWKVLVGIFVGSFLLTLLLLHFGRFELARPTMFSIVVILFAMRMKGELRGHVWFWATMLAVAALHIPLILCVPWTTRQIPALAMTPIAAVDVAAILAIIKCLDKLFEKTTMRDAGARSL